MGRINIEDFTPGMVLGEEVRTSRGRLIFSAGIKLTEKHIKTCRVWGVTEAEIQGVTEAQVQARRLALYSDNVITACKCITSRRFVLLDLSDPLVRELARQVILRMARDMTEAEAVEIIQATAHCTLDPTPDGVELPEPVQPKPDPVRIAESSVQLASLPAIFDRIIDSVKNPRSSAAHIAEIIGTDPSLSARLLRIVNSPFYGFPDGIDTLSRAVAVVGTNQLSNLAMGVSVLTMFDGIPPELIDMKGFWQHCVAVGVVSRLLASLAGLPNEERFFVGGLLHDIGRMVMFSNKPSMALRVVELCVSHRASIVAVERSQWGFDHGRLAGLLMREWKFPHGLEEMVTYHHKPHLAQSRVEPGVIHVADVIVHALGIGMSGSTRVSPLVSEVWEDLGLSKNVLSRVVGQVDYLVAEIMNIFFNDAPGGSPEEAADA